MPRQHRQRCGDLTIARQRDAETEKITYIQDHLRVEAKDNSSVISVQFEAGAPDTAAAVVNAIMTTYISTIGAARDAEIAKADQWISQQMAINWKEVESAEQRVTQFTQQNKNITEVQGALTATIQLSKDQGQLAIAREELARLQASLDTASQSGGAGTEETLNSKSVQALKELEAKTLELTYALSPSDPRRAPLKERVDGLRAQINRESKLVVLSDIAFSPNCTCAGASTGDCRSDRIGVGTGFDRGRDHTEAAHQRP